MHCSILHNVATHEPSISYWMREPFLLLTFVHKCLHMKILIKLFNVSLFYHCDTLIATSVQASLNAKYLSFLYRALNFFLTTVKWGMCGMKKVIMYVVQIFHPDCWIFIVQPSKSIHGWIKLLLDFNVHVQWAGKVTRIKKTDTKTKMSIYKKTRTAFDAMSNNDRMIKLCPH